MPLPENRAVVGRADVINRRDNLQRYVDQFAAKHNIRDKDTIDQMQSVVAGMVGKRLMYRELVAD